MGKGIHLLRFALTVGVLAPILCFGQNASWVPAKVVGCDDCSVTNLHFTTPQDGWASATIAGPGDFVLLRSTDGGKTWTVAPSNAPGHVYERAVFLNASDGWAPPHRFTHEASVEENALDAPIRFYQTSDGGNTWRLREGEIVETVTLGNAAAVEEAEWKYFQTVRFVSRSVGVMAGVLTRTGWRPDAQWYRGYIIAVTRDSGATWKAFLFGLDDVFNFCGQNPDFAASFRPPLDIAFVGETHGWISTHTCANRYVFRTTDGGLSWEVFDIRDAYPNTVGMQIEFVSPMEGWSWDDVPLTRTMDGGRTWRIPANLPVGWSAVFLSQQEGWVVGNDPEEAQVGALGSLYYTANGGITWKREMSWDRWSPRELRYDLSTRSLWVFGGFEKLWRRTVVVTTVNPSGKLPIIWGEQKAQKE